MIIWTSPISFVASANCGVYCGAEIDFVDITLETGLIDISKLSKKLLEAQRVDRLPKVLIPVHLSGASCDMSALKELSNHYNFRIIEDASHAIGGMYKNRMVGCCDYSDITVFSFHPVKIITCGEGGAALSTNPDLIDKLRLTRAHGITKILKCSKLSRLRTGRRQQTLGYNYRMSDIHASLGTSQLNRLASIVQQRNQIYNEYKKRLVDLPVNLLTIPADVVSSVHLVVMQLDTQQSHLHEKLFKYLRSNGIGVQLHYFPIHLQPFYQEKGFKRGDFPKAELYSSLSMSLPVFEDMTVEDVSYVVNSIQVFFGENV